MLGRLRDGGSGAGGLPSLLVAGRRLQRNRPPGDRGGVRPGQAGQGTARLFFLFGLCVCVCVVFILFGSYTVLPEGLSDPGKYHKKYSRDELG